MPGPCSGLAVSEHLDDDPPAPMPGQEGQSAEAAKTSADASQAGGGTQEERRLVDRDVQDIVAALAVGVGLEGVRADHDTATDQLLVGSPKIAQPVDPAAAGLAARAAERYEDGRIVGGVGPREGLVEVETDRERADVRVSVRVRIKNGCTRGWCLARRTGRDRGLRPVDDGPGLRSVR